MIQDDGYEKEMQLMFKQSERIGLAYKRYKIQLKLTGLARIAHSHREETTLIQKA